MSRRQARDLIATGAALAELPLIDRAFQEGRISWSKVRILARVAAPETEDAWLAKAEPATASEFEREAAGRKKGERPREKGDKGLPEVRIKLRLDVDLVTAELFERARMRLSAEAGEPVRDGPLVRRFAEQVLRSAGEEEGERAPAGSLFKVVMHVCRACEGKELATEDGPVPVGSGHRRGDPLRRRGRRFRSRARRS